MNESSKRKARYWLWPATFACMFVVTTGLLRRHEFNPMESRLTEIVLRFKNADADAQEQLVNESQLMGQAGLSGLGKLVEAHDTSIGRFFRLQVSPRLPAMVQARLNLLQPPDELRAGAIAVIRALGKTAALPLCHAICRGSEYANGADLNDFIEVLAWCRDVDTEARATHELLMSRSGE